MARRRDEHDNCPLPCIACGRPKDNFGHLHIKPRTAEGAEAGSEVVLCVPCLSNISAHYGQLISAYLSGGLVFDRFAQRRARRNKHRADAPSPRTPLPPWMADFVQDIANSLEQTTDASDEEIGD